MNAPIIEGPMRRHAHAVLNLRTWGQNDEADALEKALNQIDRAFGNPSLPPITDEALAWPDKAFQKPERFVWEISADERSGKVAA